MDNLTRQSIIKELQKKYKNLEDFKEYITLLSESQKDDKFYRAIKVMLDGLKKSLHSLPHTDIEIELVKGELWRSLKEFEDDLKDKL